MTFKPEIVAAFEVPRRKSYMTETHENGYKRRTIDLPGFAFDLAAALKKIRTDVHWIGGVGDYPNEYQAVMIGNDRLDLRSVRRPGNRVRAYLEAPDVRWTSRHTYDQAQRTEFATVNPNGRSIDTIAKDINKDVIVANQPALAARRAYAAAQGAARTSIVQHMDELKAAFPGLAFRHRKGEQTATFYGSGTFDGYLSGTLSSDGSVTLDRLSLTNEQFRAVAALLTKKG